MTRLLAAALLAFGAAALMHGCGGEGTSFGQDSLVSGDSDLSAFTRGCQYYFRGSLSRARDQFNGVVYRHPTSPLVEDSRLALRRIESELSGELVEDTTTTAGGTVFSVVLVTKPYLARRAGNIAASIRAGGGSARVVEDEGSPDMTVVLYPVDGQSLAQQVADSLSLWLLRPETVPVQPAGGLTSSIVPGYDGIVVIIGSEATLDPDAPRSMGDGE